MIERFAWLDLRQPWSCLFSDIAELKTINRKHSDSDEIGGNTVPRGTSERLQSLISLTKKAPRLEGEFRGRRDC